MLPLKSPRWLELDTFRGSPEQVPIILEKWVAALGSDQEETIYTQGLFQMYLHQMTITNVAYAVVPWMVAHLHKTLAVNRAQYLYDIAFVELMRMTCGVYFVRPGGDKEPAWLMEDYHAAIKSAQSEAELVMEERLLKEVRNDLWQVMPALFGKIELAQQRLGG